jgi:hypothetical protein
MDVAPLGAANDRREKFEYATVQIDQSAAPVGRCRSGRVL